ncbi:MAG: methyltransferase domain-containing protein [Rhodocyclaceae bacterium]|nr:methyltransferase domain-containing protein [Rhodocyclaceae bacterium]
MTHEFDGEKYRLASAHQKEWGARLIGELRLAGTERILDLGCGDGALTAQLAALVPQGAVTGIDASAGMIAAARSHQAANLSFKVADINDGQSFGSGFDVIFSNAALHWVADHQTLLGNALRALNGGGAVAFSFAGEGNCANFIRVVKAAMQLPQFARFFSGFAWPWYMPDLAAYRQLVRGFPFAESSVRGENADRYFTDQETMIKWIDQPSLVPFMQCLPDEFKETFRQCVIARMIEASLQPDGRCFETFRRINVIARK